MADVAPIIVDLGKQRRKKIKQFKRGEGDLIHEIEQAIAEVRSGLGAEAEGKEIVPVVVIYREKRSKRRGLFPF